MASALTAFKPPRQGLTVGSRLSGDGKQASQRADHGQRSGSGEHGGARTGGASPSRTQSDSLLPRNPTAQSKEMPMVEITSDNGKVYSTICDGDEAIVFERTLKSKFHDALWKGNFDIKEVSADCDWSPRLLNGQLCWVLPPGQYYEARSNRQADDAGVGRTGRSSYSASLSGMRTAFSGLRAGSSAGSYRTALPTGTVRRRSEVPAASHMTATSGQSKRPRRASEGDACSERRATAADGTTPAAAGGSGKGGSPGVRGGEPTSQGMQEVDQAGVGLADMEVEEVEGIADKGKKGDKSPIRGSIVESVLCGTMRRDNGVRKLFEEYQNSGKEIPVVEYVPMPMDGNVVYIRPRGSGLSDYLNAGKHWGGCKTTHLGLKNKETARLWECRGGKKCVNDECWYVKRTGKACTRAFVKATDGAVECLFCGHPAMNTGLCGAKRYEVQGEKESAHVHLGTHNHDLGETVDQELLDKFYEAAMEAAAADPRMTPARFIQLSIREKLMERIKNGGVDVTDFASLVKSVQPLARMDKIRRTMAKGRLLAGANTRSKYGGLDIAKKLGFPFVHRLFLAEQQLQPTSEVPMVFMMTVQGRGSGLHVAREMSVPGSDLYFSTAYVDAQKVTAEDEVLTRFSTYSHVQRRMLTIASALIESESKKNMVAFMKELKKICLTGWPAGGQDGEGFWEAIPPFALDFWKLCSDAAEGPAAAYREVVSSGTGRGALVQCEMHFKKDLRNAEHNLPEDLRGHHRSLVRMWLVSETDEQWKSRFHALLDWYESKLQNNKVAKRKMCNWAAFWRFKSKELKAWSMPENVKFLEEEWVAVNPSANNAEIVNAVFWFLVGGKGPYLPRGEVILNEGTSAVLQIARTVEFEETGYTGQGPTLEDLRARGEERRKSVETQRENARRMSGAALADVARGAGLATGTVGGGVKSVVSKTAWAASSPGSAGVESTHRHDRVRKEVDDRTKEKGKGKQSGAERGGEDGEVKGSRYYEELAIEISEGKKKLEDLPVEERERVVELQRMAAAGAARGGAGARPPPAGTPGPSNANAGQNGQQVDEAAGPSASRREDEPRVAEAGSRQSEREDEDVVMGEGGERSTEAIGVDDEDEEELIRRRAEKRLQEKSRGRQASWSDEFGAEDSERGGAKKDGTKRGSESVALPGDERYEEGEWGVCRLKKGDSSGCVGVKIGGGRCETTSFEAQRYHGASGVLVLMRQAFRHFGLQNRQGEYENTGMKYMSYAKMCIDGPCDSRQGTNKSLVDKTTPEKGNEVGIFEGTLLSDAELAWLRQAGWKVNPFNIISLQKVHSEQVTYKGQVKQRGKPPRNDALSDVENESERQRRQREEAAARRAERELEREKREVEKEMGKRPSERPEGRKVKKVGRVIRDMETRLEQALEMETTVHVEKFVQRESLEVLVEEASALFSTRMGGRYRVTIDAAPRCDEICPEYAEMTQKTSGSWVHCRHVYAVLRVGLRLFDFTDGDEKGVPLIHQATFSEKELRSILSQGLDVKAMGGEIMEYATEEE